MIRIFDNKLNSVINTMKRYAASKEVDTRNKEAIVHAIERVVDGTDSKIRLINGYQKKLWNAVSYSLDYVDDLVERIPGAMNINRNSFISDPSIHAFFVNIEHLQSSFSRSSELRDFFDSEENRELTESYALLCMKRKEKSTFGIELDGAMLKRDVPQVTVGFADHQVLSPAPTEEQAREGLKKCLFDGLVTNALECISSRRSSRQLLENRKRHLQIELRNLESHSQKPESFTESSSSNYSQIREIERKVDDIEKKLRKTETTIATPNDYLEQVNKVMKHPEKFVRLKNFSIKINKLGIKIKKGSAQSGNRINLAEVTIGEARRRIVTLAKYPRSEMLPKEDFLDKARRVLFI